jgi:hypothetical protein
LFVVGQMLRLPEETSNARRSLFPIRGRNKNLNL